MVPPSTLSPSLHLSTAATLFPYTTLFRSSCSFGEVEQLWRRDLVFCSQFQHLAQRLHLAQLLTSQRDLQQEVDFRARLKNERLMTMSFDQRTELSHVAKGRKRPLEFFLDLSPSHVKRHYPVWSFATPARAQSSSKRARSRLLGKRRRARGRTAVACGLLVRVHDLDQRRLAPRPAEDLKADRQGAVHEAHRHRDRRKARRR